MPSIAKTFALVLVVASPPSLTAQTFMPGDHRFSTAGGDRSGPGAVGLTAPESPRAGFGSTSPPGNRSAHDGRITEGRNVTTAAVPLSPPSQTSPLPLSAPGRSNRADQRKRAGGLASPLTVISSLAVVLGIFFLVAWGMRRATPPGLTALPAEVFEMLGRAPLAGRQHVHLLRCGKKLLLVSVTAAGAETLTEITDPMEVDRLAGICRQAHPNSATEAFRQVFGQFAARRPKSGLLEGSDRDRGGLAGTTAFAGNDGLENRNV